MSVIWIFLIHLHLFSSASVSADKRPYCKALCGEFMEPRRPFTSRLGSKASALSADSALAENPAAKQRDYHVEGGCGLQCFEEQCVKLYGGDCPSGYHGCYCAYFTPRGGSKSDSKYRCVKPGCEGGPIINHTCTVTSCDGLLGGTETSQDVDPIKGACVLPWPFCG